MAKVYVVDPQISGDVFVGTEGDDSLVYMGQVGESGPARKLFFGGSREFVGLIIGKRGSGKSYTLGGMLEGLATRQSQTSISKHKTRRAMLLLDPMGNFWTTAYAVRKDAPEKVRKQWESLEGWNCKPEEVDVSVWIPAGFRTDHDPDHLKEFRIRVSDLDAADIADLIGLNLVRDPQGAVLDEAYSAVTEVGWDDGQRHRPPKAEFSFQDLVEYVEHLRSAGGSDHQVGALKALVRSLKLLERQPVFSGAGTKLNELLVLGRLSVLMLPMRLGADLRRVVTRLLIRRILREREAASQLKQRLDVEAHDEAKKGELERKLQEFVPRSVLAIDEAQELLGDEGGEAKEALEQFCLLGRNYGLSLLLATQRPTASAISSKVRSQVDAYFIHRLLTQEDIDICYKNLLGLYPKEVLDGDRTLEFSELLRSLKQGQVVVSASHVRANSTVRRIVIGRIRPRVTVHGGEVL